MSTQREKYNKKESGFTLIEVLVSLVVLTMALVPALVLSTLAINVSYSIRNNLIASNLAQEGVEVIRAIRDKNWLNSYSFDNDLSDGAYRVEWDSNLPIALGNNPFLKINNDLYNYGSGNDTIFHRTITITKLNSAELKIVSDVSWTERNRNKNVQIESHLFDWK